MIYGSWSEGFTDAATQILNLPVVAPAGCPATVSPPREVGAGLDIRF